MRRDLESSCIGEFDFKMALVTVSTLDYDPRRESKTVKRSITTITDANKCVLPLRQELFRDLDGVKEKKTYLEQLHVLTRASMGVRYDFLRPTGPYSSLLVDRP